MNTLNTPALSVIGESKAQDEISAGLNSLSDDWHNVEADREDPNCKIHYGVAGGKLFGYCEQSDMNNYLEYARHLRENEFKLGKKDLPFGKLKWIMPRAVKLEMMARGYPIDEIMESGDMYEIDIFIEKHFPELKATSLILSKQKVPLLTA